MSVSEYAKAEARRDVQRGAAWTHTEPKEVTRKVGESHDLEWMVPEDTYNGELDPEVVVRGVLRPSWEGATDSWTALAEVHFYEVSEREGKAIMDAMLRAAQHEYLRIENALPVLAIIKAESVDAMHDA
jgi:hypothetical protein